MVLAERLVLSLSSVIGRFWSVFCQSNLSVWVPSIVSENSVSLLEVYLSVSFSSRISRLWGAGGCWHPEYLKIVCTEGLKALSRVPVNVVVCQLMIHSNVIVGITISRGSLVFSHSRVKVSASLTGNVGSLAVGAFDLVNCSPSVVGFVRVFNVSH